MAAPSLNFRPQILDLYIYAADGLSIKLACKDKAGNPIDINGSVAAQIRVDRIHPTDTPLATFTVSLVDAYMGIVGLTLSAASSLALLPPGENEFVGVWDVQWTPATALPRTLVQGKVECVADVTR